MDCKLVFQGEDKKPLDKDIIEFVDNEISGALEDPAVAFEKAQEVAKNLEFATLTEKRNAMINAKKHKIISERISNEVNSGNITLYSSLQGLLVGTDTVRKDGKVSVAQGQTAWGLMIEGKFIGLLSKLGGKDGKLHEILNSGTQDEAIAAELFALTDNRYGEVGHTGNADAVKIAKAFKEVQDFALAQQNLNGAFIRKVKGYIARANHDPSKILLTPMDKYISDVKEYFNVDDWTQEELENLYHRMVTGNHDKISETVDESLKGFKGAGNLAKYVSQGRTLVPRTPQDFIKYNAKYGSGSLADSLSSDLRFRARSIGIMEVLGTNPRNMFNRLLKEKKIEFRDNQKVSSEFNSSMFNPEKRLINYLDTVDGTALHRPSSFSGKLMNTFPKVTSMISLGFAMISSIVDFGSSAIEKQSLGKSIHGSFIDTMKELKFLSKEEKQKLALHLNVINHDIGRSAMAKVGMLDANNGFNNIDKGANLYFKYGNFLTPFTNKIHTGHATAIGIHLGEQRNKAFNELPERLRKTMGQHGIDSGKWDLLRHSPTETEFRDIKLISSDQAFGLPDDMIRGYLDNPKASNAELNRFRSELARDIHSLYVESSYRASLVPSAKEISELSLNTHSDTAAGMLVRLATQFKQFPYAFLRKNLTRQISMESNVQSKMLAGANMFATMSALGMVAVYINDLLKGREPILEKPSDWAKFASRGITKGGGAGIVGDVLFADYSIRYGKTLKDIMIGPAVSKVSELAGITSQLVQGNFSKGGREAVKFAERNNPISNLFYTKAAFDYMLYFNINEMMNPNSFERYKRGVERTTNTRLFLEPLYNR